MSKLYRCTESDKILTEAQLKAEFETLKTEEPTTFEAIAKFIYNCFLTEKRYNDGYKNYSEQQVFFDWCSGLPSVIDTCYFYNRSAVDDLATILEETEAEKEKYSESDAEKLLTNLIYREIKKAI